MNTTPEPAAASALKPVPKMGGKSDTIGDITGPLLSSDMVEDLRRRWEGVQAAFIDEPRTSVRQADELVASAIKRLAEKCDETRNTMERGWTGGDMNTEDLRIAIKKYRTFFQKLMTL